MAHSECGGRRSLRSSCRTRSTTHPRRGTCAAYNMQQVATCNAACSGASCNVKCDLRADAASNKSQVATPMATCSMHRCSSNYDSMGVARTQSTDQPTNASEVKRAVQATTQCDVHPQCDVPVSARRHFGSNRNCSGDLTSTSDPQNSRARVRVRVLQVLTPVVLSYLYSSETPTQNSSAAIQWMTTTKKTITCRREH